MADGKEPKPEADVEPKPQPSTASDQEILDKMLSRPSEDLIPWEPCTLPSQGMYYAGAIPNGTIQVRAWGIQTDKILATSRLAQSGKALDYVIKSCVRLPEDFNHMNLLVGDRVFLLYYLRGITYGNQYEFLVECNNEQCENVWTEIYDLNELASTIISPNADLGDEPFKLTLPYLSKMASKEMGAPVDFWIKVRLLRGYDLAGIMQQRRVSRKLRPTARTRQRQQANKAPQAGAMSQEELDETISENLRMVIVEVMGDKNAMKISKLVDNMHAADTATIREFLRDNSPGIETTIEVECSECSQSQTMDLPITESFFRPTGPGGSRE